MRERTGLNGHRTRRVTRAALLVAVASLAACNFAPRYRRPVLPTPPAFDTAGDTSGAGGSKAPTVAWRTVIRDPQLEALITTALTRNRDLVIAVARIDEARGLYGIQRADRLPTISAIAGATQTRSNLNALGPIGGGGGGGGVTVPPTDAPPTAVTFERYTAGVGVTAFELDFWGRVRNLSAAARSRYLATVQAARSFRLSVIRDVASTYLASVEARERIALSEATVAGRIEGLRIAKVRFDAGITSELEYRQAESLLTQAETALAALRQARAQSDNALAVLVGDTVPGTLSAALPLHEQASTVALEAGLPSELLLARPDILGAEELLRAANANIGAARAAFFPSITLTGTTGFTSNQLTGLVGTDNRSWTFGPNISVPIFNLGRTRGNLTVATAQRDIAVATYERTVQVAFREVADALAGRRYLAEQVAAQERGTQAQRRIAGLARIRYNEGVVTFLEVLDAERNLFTSEQALLQLRRTAADNLITLYIALGGGSLGPDRS